MRCTLATILPIFITCLAWGGAPESALQESYQQQMLKRRFQDLKRLRGIKYLMINGDLVRAQRRLQQFHPQFPQLRIIQKRYLATLWVLQGQWQRALKVFNAVEFQSPSAYRTVCPLKVLALVATQKRDQAGREFGHCFDFKEGEQTNDATWMSALITGTNPISLPRDGDDFNKVKIGLKLALYLGQEKQVLEHLGHIDKGIVRDQRIKELLALIHHRLGDRSKALSLLEGVGLANGQNLQGNEALKEGDISQAGEHFKQALKKKGDSLNAIRRLLPVAWKQRDFASGWDAMKLALELGQAEGAARIHLSALLTELDKPQKVILHLLLLPWKERQQHTALVNELLAFNYLVSSRPKKALLAARKSCELGNVLSCYLSGALARWDNFSETLKSDRPIPSPEGIDITQLSGETLEGDPFAAEIRYVDQENIQRLDRAYGPGGWFGED